MMSLHHNSAWVASLSIKRERRITRAESRAPPSSLGSLNSQARSKSGVARASTSAKTQKNYDATSFVNGHSSQRKEQRERLSDRTPSPDSPPLLVIKFQSIPSLRPHLILLLRLKRYVKQSIMFSIASSSVRRAAMSAPARNIINQRYLSMACAQSVHKLTTILEEYRAKK